MMLNTPFFNLLCDAVEALQLVNLMVDRVRSSLNIYRLYIHEIIYDVRSSPSLASFCKKLKSYLYQDFSYIIFAIQWCFCGAYLDWVTGL